MRALAILLGFYALGAFQLYASEEEFSLGRLFNFRTLDVRDKKIVEESTFKLVRFSLIKNVETWFEQWKNGALRTYISETLEKESASIQPDLLTTFDNLKQEALKKPDNELSQISEELALELCLDKPFLF